VTAVVDRPEGDCGKAQVLHPGRHRREGDSSVSVITAPDEGAEVAKKRASEGKRAEQRLGLMLCAPAIIVMLAVAAYPILYAIYLSFFKADLRTPNANEFIWFSNYVTVLSSSIWWGAFGLTLFITVVSTAFELVF